MSGSGTEVQIVSIGKTTGKQIHAYLKSMNASVAGAFYLPALEHLIDCAI